MPPESELRDAVVCKHKHSAVRPNLAYSQTFQNEAATTKIFVRAIFMYVAVTYMWSNKHI